MSLSLFNAVSVEVLVDHKNQPWIHRAQYGRFLGLTDIHKSIPKDMKREQAVRSELEPGWNQIPPRFGMYGGGKNSHDMFMSIELAVYLAMRSDKENAKSARNWILKEIIPRGFNAIIKKKDTQLTLLNDDLTEAQDHVRQLEFNNTGLQGEVRAKDQEIERRETEVAELRRRSVDYCRDPQKDNVVVISRKHTTDEEDKHFDYPYYISRIQRRAIPTKRRWILEQFPRSEEIVVIDNPNSVHTFNRFEEEGHVERYGCHFRLIDLTREDLYNMGVPAI